MFAGGSATFAGYVSTGDFSSNTEASIYLQAIAKDHHWIVYNIKTTWKKKQVASVASIGPEEGSRSAKKAHVKNSKKILTIKKSN